MTNTKTYIDVNLAKAQFTGNFNDAYPTSLIKAMIDDVPIADVREIHHGVWMTKTYIEDSKNGDYWKEVEAERGDCGYCSLCRAYGNLDGAEDFGLSNYCGNCGAEMSNGVTSNHFEGE